MKVLMLNTFDTGGGAAIAAIRLLRGVRQQGVDSSLLVQFKAGDARDIICNETPFAKGSRSLKLYLELQPVRLYPNRPEANFSLALLPDRLSSKVACLNPDLVHLHWLAAGFLRLETLKKFKKPLVWTLHDSWAFTGGCHVPFECKKYQERCGACPVLGSSREGDLSRLTWKRKEKAWRDLDLTVVAPSRWLADCARSSTLFRGVRVEVIPNGLDLTHFRPIDKRLARELLLLPQGKKLILFGAVGSTSDRNKGFHLLLPALQKMAAEGWKAAAELIVFGASEPVFPPPFGMPASYLGWIHDDISLALLYAAADVFVVPSLQEAFCQTAVEAMACGTPVVAFEATGLVDVVEHRKCGYLAQPYDIEDLARGITWVLEDVDRYSELSSKARQKVETEFDIAIVSQRYAALYRGILSNAAGGRHG